jgi:hypothetical protein
VNGSSIASTAPGRPSALGDPARDQLDLRLREAPHAGELAVARHRLPRRHVPAAHHVPDVVAPRARVAIAQERERRHLAGPVTGLAVLLEDAHHLLAEGDALARRHGDGRRRRRRGRLAGGGQQDERERSPDHFSRTSS